MEEIKNNIAKILDQFMAEEIGNRLSQFAMMALKNLIMKELEKQSEKGEEK